MRRCLSLIALSATTSFPSVLAAKQDSVAKLDPVLVTVTRGTGQSVLRSPFALSVIRPDSSRPGQRHTSIDETLAIVPGLSVTNRNNPSQDPRLSIRGFGARSTFGVRGIRVLRDGMPLTLPDGQTPLDYLSLESVGRIEVMRGAASALYGNASGGVIDIRSAPPPPFPLSVKVSQWLGDNRFSRTALAAGGTSGSANYQGDVSFSRSDGSRAHSRQRAVTGFGRSGVTLGRTEIGLTVLALDNPLAQNPGPLTSVELRADPAAADALSVRRDARKATRQIQVGLSAMRPVGTGEVAASVFEGARSLDNPLTFAIVEVGRHTYGASAHFIRDAQVLGITNRFVVGTDLQSQNDLRRNFATCADTIPLAQPTATCPTITGERGIVTLDQRELVSSAGIYAKDDISLGVFSVSAGVRSDNVRFEVKDRLITQSNPDDSGNRSLGAVSPVIAALLKLAPTHSLYANVASAFETPTATELGNQPDGSAGINQDLKPQRSTTIEAGLKGFFGGKVDYDVAAYTTQVRDELVPFEIAGSNGRRYFRNAGRTVRRGAEASSALRLGPVTFAGAYTLSAFRFDAYQSGGLVYDGNIIPGVPRNRWQASMKLAGEAGFAVFETEGASSVFLNDANSATGSGYTSVNLRVGTAAVLGSARLAVSAGIQNIFDRRYAASIAVNAARGKYFEPASPRSLFVGVSVASRRLD